jgi:DNA replication protein DnaC
VTDAALQSIVDAHVAELEREAQRRQDWTTQRELLLHKHTVEELNEMGETKLAAMKRRFTEAGIVGDCSRCRKPVKAEDADGSRGAVSRLGPSLWSSHRNCEELFREREREARRQSTERAIRDRFDTDAAGGSLGLSALPNWPWARFDNPEFVRRASRRVLAAYKKYRLEQGNLIVSGLTGRTKTSGIVAWLHDAQKRAIDAVDHKLAPRFLFVTGPTLANARRRAPIGQEAPLVDLATRTALLVLDELGFEPEAEEIFFVVDARYRAALPTVITTGRPIEWVKDNYGAAFFRRLIEHGDVVEDQA